MDDRIYELEDRIKLIEDTLKWAVCPECQKYGALRSADNFMWRCMNCLALLEEKLEIKEG